jgi:hypothetical protein
LASGEFARSWSDIWTASWVGYAEAPGSDREVLRPWLEATIGNGVPYDQIVSQLIAATGDSAVNGPATFLARHPDDEVSQVSRLFLGVRLGCARCHDHPFDRWTKTDYEHFARFFQATERQEVTAGNVRLVNLQPPSDPGQRPRFLTGAEPRTTQWRDELALFVTRSKPFARTFGNRLWYHLFGRGIVHPPDDRSEQNAPSIPRLYEYLGERAREERFVLRPLVREICGSRAYQLSSVSPRPDPIAESSFAYRIIKPLTPEQMYDSIMTGLNRPLDRIERREWIRRAISSVVDEDFSRTWEYQDTVQSLLDRLTQLDELPRDWSIAESFERLLGRSPTATERDKFAARPPDELVFALIHSNEFAFNR